MLETKEKILIVKADFYSDIATLLLEGASGYLKKNGYEYDIISVSGAFEIPAIINMFAKSKNCQYIGFVALGCIIRGETSHYDYVCNETARALMDLSINHDLLIGNAILTVENKKQAIERADINKKDKGGFAAEACANLIQIKQSFI